MYFEDVLNMSDDELLEQLLLSGTPGAHDYELAERELNRRYLRRVEAAVGRLEVSSKRLEGLTWALVVLTIVLIAFAGFDAFTKLH